MAIKLKPAQKVFFERYARNTLVNTTLVSMAEMGLEVNKETETVVASIVATADVQKLSEVIAEEMLKRVEFRVLTKMENFMKSEDSQRAMQAAREVSALVFPSIMEVVDELFALPEDASEK